MYCELNACMHGETMEIISKVHRVQLHQVATELDGHRTGDALFVHLI